MLFGTPIIRSLFIVGAFMFFSFGLWNVLLLPFAIEDAAARPSSSTGSRRA